MAKPKMRGKSIDVEVSGVIYTFNPIDGTFADIEPNKLIIIALDLKRNCFTDIWVCDAETDYELQGHMEAILVSDRHKWFDKSHAMTRLTACDANSYSFTGPNKKTINMVRMGDKFYATKLN
ncbi:hypothetical protein pEaSNUABM37_00075 [Erwinia phage pEa_SNUABM_37]|nr:hypothetical protein pEaSNUABM37_00075 [Erwinia phage pEa_SNUABM_37]QXO10545.1 hypothetical protein pEaSNUABM48_00075 [Erwinia phage pEa_SNUABM_48]